MKGIIYRGRDGWPLHATVLETSPATSDPVLVLLHGGGPDHHSMIPLATQLADLQRPVLPDIRGYGRSACADAARHTWNQYVDDVMALLDHLGAQRGTLIGTGIGTTIALRAALAHPDRLAALVLISVEEIEDDAAKVAEIELLDAFANRVRSHGLQAAWEPLLQQLAPLIGTLVREAIPRADPASIVAAAAIGHDRSFRSVDELAAVTVPTLIIPGMDARHPRALAESLSHLMGNAHVAPVALSTMIRNADDLAHAFAPAIRRFLVDHSNSRYSV